MTPQRLSLISGAFALAAGAYWIVYALIQFEFIQQEYRNDPAITCIVGGLAVLAVLCNVAAGIEAFRGKPSWCGLLVKTHLLVLILIAICYSAFSDSYMLSTLAVAWCGGWFGIGSVPLSLTPFLLMGQWIAAERAEAVGTASLIRGVAIGALLMLGALGIAASASTLDSHLVFTFFALGTALHFFTAFALYCDWRLGAWMAMIVGIVCLVSGMTLERLEVSNPASMMAGVQFVINFGWHGLAPWIPQMGYAAMTICGVWLCFFGPNAAAPNRLSSWNRQ